ncbi:MAG TPA: IPT/TIG domain-containing protein, partial [Candidatus Angelobacter sp.]|nr:IPT/TIG domain-containing protein [Candidatus Angelobacter sp.]
VVSSVTPASGIAGTQVTFTGTGLGTTQGSGNVWLGSTYGVIVSWTDTQVVATIASGAKSGTAQILQGGVWSDPINFSVITPVVSSVTPTDGVAGTQVTFTGTGFGATQGSGNVWLGSTYGTVVSWSDTQVAATVAQGATSGTAQILQGGVWSDPVNFRIDSSGPLLQFSVADTPLQVNLTSSQNLDWIHWGRVSATLPDRKGGITPLISDYTAVNGAPSASSGNIGFSWTDEYNQAAVSETLADVETFAANGGFQITVPADTSVKTLKLYVEVFTGQGQLQASLSDGSAATISDQSVTDSDIASKVYSIDFRAGSPNQTLTVTFTSLNAAGGVGLQAATLTQHLPVVSITSPAAGQSFAAPGAIQFNATATQFDYPISDVHATGSDGTVMDSPASPLAANWGPLAAGHYSITATATDSLGLTNISAPVETDVIGQGGSLSIEENSPSSPIDLDAQGSGDWVLWGPVNTGDFIINNPGNLLARKSGVAPLISDYKLIGNHGVYPLASSHNLLFRSASQNFGAAGSEAAVFGLRDGFEITVPADTTPRTLQLYVGDISGDLSVTGFLSDGSAPVATEVGGSGPPPGPTTNTTLYTITYNAASSGQTLTLRLTLGSDQGGGEAVLIAAALNGPSVAPTVPAPQITAINPASAPANSKVTITGTNFGATQGDSSVLFGQLSAQVVSWSDTSIVVTVPAGLRDGSTTQVVVFTDNGTSNAVNFTTPAFKLYPPSLSLVVGQTALATPKDSSGNPVTGLTWTTKDPNIVSLSSDDPPLITALAVGSATVYAGDVTLPVTVYPGTSLPPGTVLWSVPLGSGSGNISLVPAVPSANGADIFALDDTGTLTALDTDSTPVWKISGIPGGPSAKVIPDFSGRALVIAPYTFRDAQGNYHTTSKLYQADPANGLTDLYTFQNDASNGTNLGGAPTVTAIPHPSGLVFIHDNSAISLIDPASGQSLASLTLDNSTLTINGQTNAGVPSFVGSMIVAADGNAYVPYDFVETTETRSGRPSPDSTHTVEHAMLLRLSPDGTSAKTELLTSTSDSTCVPWTPPGHAFPDGQQCSNSRSTGPGSNAYLAAITNADQGVAVFSTTVPGILCATQFLDNTGLVVSSGGCQGDLQAHTAAIYVSQDAVNSTTADAVVLPNDDARLQAFVPILQREDGSYIGTDTQPNSFWAGSRLIAVSGGSMLWNQNVGPALDTVPRGSPTAPFLTPLYATTDGGIIVRSAQEGNCQDNPPQCKTVSSTLYTLDQDGNVTGQTSDPGAVLSWSDKWYGSSPLQGGSPSGLTSVTVNSTLASGAVTSLAFAPITWASSFWPDGGGSPSPKGAARFMTLRFATGLPKSPKDRMLFMGPGRPTCSEDLGLHNCPATAFWNWSVEIVAHVNDDASNWVLKQSAKGWRKGRYRVGGQYYDWVEFRNHPDDDPKQLLGPPCCLQQDAGQKYIFELDAPGQSYVYKGVGPIDHDIFVDNFTTFVCTKAKLNNCMMIKWYLEMIVTPGGILDTTNSKVGIGSIEPLIIPVEPIK